MYFHYPFQQGFNAKSLKKDGECEQLELCIFIIKTSEVVFTFLKFISTKRTIIKNSVELKVYKIFKSKYFELIGHFQIEYELNLPVKDPFPFST